MKKILFALNDMHFSEAAFSFVKKFNGQEPAFVTGLYIPDFINNIQWTTSLGDAAFFVPRLIEEDETMVRGNIMAFEEACTKHQIGFQVETISETSVLEGVRKATRFADLLVIGLDGYYNTQTKDFADEELKKIIEHAECPVLLVPNNSRFPDNIVIAYNGSETSVYALKMFAYIFPSMTDLQTMVVYADVAATELPDTELIKELTARHFSNLGFSVLEFNPGKYFVTWIEEHPKTLLVAGAYGRSELSQLFKRSFINDLLEQFPVPIFIAHK